jgi:hypothetical protein
MLNHLCTEVIHVFINDILKTNTLTSLGSLLVRISEALATVPMTANHTLVPNLVSTDISIGSGDHKVVSSQHLKPPTNSTVNRGIIVM